MSDTTSLSGNTYEDGVIENISDNTIENESINSDYSESDHAFINSININDEINDEELSEDEKNKNEDEYETNQTENHTPNAIIPNKEQQDIIDCIKEGNNVIVNAVAGSGKSTTILSAVKQLKNKRFLLITYNKDLVSELNHKLREDWWSDINYRKRIEIKTYHAYGSYYLDVCKDDIGIIKICNEQVPLKNTLLNINNELCKIDYIVIDEVQDMTMELFTFVRKLIIDINLQQGFRPYLVLIGDVYQSVYRFNGAESRFLEEPRLWEGLYDGFIFKTLKVSFRIPCNVAKYINEDVLGEKRIISHDQDESRPSCFQYIVNLFKDQEHSYGNPNIMAYKINKYINTHKPSSVQQIIDYSKKELKDERDNRSKEGKPIIITDKLSDNYLSMCSICFSLINRWIEIEGNNYEDIFILSPTIKTKEKQTNFSDNTKKKQNLKPINILQHFITDTLANKIKSRYPLYIPNSDNDIVSSEDVKGRIAITTFHQSKGRERKFVIILGYEQSYYYYFNKTGCEYECAPALYVALTRAKRELHLLSHFNTKQPYNFNEFKFLRKSCLLPSNYIHVIDEVSISKQSNKHPELTSDLKFKSLDIINKEIYEGIKLFNTKDDNLIVDDINLTILNKFDDINNELTEFIDGAKNINCRLMTKDEKLSYSKKKNEINYHYSVTDMIKFVRPSFMYEINKIISKIMTSKTKPIKLIEPETKIKYQSGQGPTLTDNISNYNSMCLTSIFEQTIIRKESTIITNLRNELLNKKDSIMLNDASKSTSERVYRLINKIIEDHDQYSSLINKERNKYENINSLFMASVLYDTISSFYTHKLHIVDDYYRFNHQTKHNYIRKETAKIACDNIRHNLFNKSIADDINDYESEKVIKSLFIIDNNSYILEGRLDLVDEDGIYELKCVKELTDEHQIQICLYAWLWMVNNPTDNRKFRLINIKDGTRIDIITGTNDKQRRTTFKYLNKIINLLLENKIKSDRSFIEPIETLVKKCNDETKSMLKSVINVHEVHCERVTW